MNKDAFHRYRLQFLPAALEIQHTPPHPLARWLGFSVMAFVGLALLWACIAKVDVVAVAEGKIIPSSRVKLVQPLEKGVVKHIFVTEGQWVTAGEPLVELDRTSTAAERERLANELHQQQERLARASGFLARLENSTAPLAQPTALQNALLEQQWQHYSAQLAALNSQRDNRKAEQQVNSEVMRKLHGTLPIVTKRAADLKILAAKKLVAENQYLELEEIRISQQQDLAAASARDTQLAAAIAEMEQHIAAHIAQTRAETLLQIADAERLVNSVREQFTQAQDFDAKQVLYAPVDGQVQGLAINTVGGVVLEAQQLMRIVPQQAQLEVEAWLRNEDIGFVQENAPAQIKIHTFPFTKYGAIPATVTRIAGDAVAPDGEQQTGATATRAGKLVFGMSLVMARNTLQVDEREVTLMPGMQVTAEIITHQRRIIDYILSPISKRVQESGRER